jgi:hypothetical protein
VTFSTRPVEESVEQLTMVSGLGPLTRGTDDHEVIVRTLCQQDLAVNRGGSHFAALKIGCTERTENVHK